MSLLNGQRYVTPQRGMPVDDKGSSSTVVAVTGETVQLYYFSSEVLTADAGEAAGTVVMGFLAYDNIKNAMGSAEATKANTSLSFTSTALTTERQMSEQLVEDNDQMSDYTKATVITSGFANGEYCVDYAKGVIYAVKADTGTSLTAATYKIKQAISGGSSAVASSVDVAKYGGTATTLGQKAMTASMPVVLPSDQDVEVVGNVAHDAADSGNPVKVGGKYNATAPTLTDGDRGDAQMDSKANLLNSLGTKLAGEDLTNDVQGVVNKPLALSTYAWSVDRSTALEASSVAKASAGVMRYFSGRLDSTLATGTYYVQFLNAASLPADGAVTTLTAPTKVSHVTGSDTPVVVDFTMNGVYASSGIVWCISSTEYTKTIGGAYVSGTMLYI